MMAQLGSTLLAIAMMVAGYLIGLCVTPPNPPPEQKSRYRTDRISLIVGKFATIVRWIAGSVVMYHVFLTVVLQYAPTRTFQVCPRPQNTNSELFAWNSLSITALLLIYTGAYVRLWAYGGLGKYFTFHLAEPEQLVTTGVYGWIQHPSYTGIMMMSVGFMVLFLRWDATPACWISELALSQWHGWGPSIFVLFVGIGSLLVATRVRDEENMLKQKFGQKWEEWHRSTKRFIPGLF
ncbi:hypothetical protein DV736_g4980, partial [Chaetothyriales sp. CBS 134916]